MDHSDAEQNEQIKRIMTSPSYEKAYLDLDFLQRSEMRAVRLHLELAKAELAQKEQGIESTIVVFGSARTKSPDLAEDALRAAEELVERDPGNLDALAELELAKRDTRMSVYYDAARTFGKIVSSACQVGEKCEFLIVTGGGPGIMEAGNRGAFDVGAKSMGLNISLPFEQHPNPYISPELCFNFHYFAIRKMHFLIRAKALVAFPGGFGTLDELFNTLTLMQTGKMQRVPIVLYGRPFWDKLINFESMVEAGTISPRDLHLFKYADDPQEAWDIIKDFHKLDDSP
ncbi:MAG: hypothetical protein ACI9OU_000877 [Candidatus Promineifilaceae bacterium]|jgi:uncharacterized protein (TIGR00730 family)